LEQNLKISYLIEIKQSLSDLIGTKLKLDYVSIKLPLSLQLIGKRDKDGRTYNLPSASEVAVLIVGDTTNRADRRGSNSIRKIVVY